VRFDAGDNGTTATTTVRRSATPRTPSTPTAALKVFQNIIATTQSGNTVLYAFGSGQPASYSGYLIGEYSSNGTLLATATDPKSTGWLFGLPAPPIGRRDLGGRYSQHNQAYNNATVWEFSYNLGSVTAFEDNVGAASTFNCRRHIGNQLYAVGAATVAGGQDYLIAGLQCQRYDRLEQELRSRRHRHAEWRGNARRHLFVVGSETSGGTTEGVLMEIDPSTGNVISTITYHPAQYNSSPRSPPMAIISMSPACPAPAQARHGRPPDL